MKTTPRCDQRGPFRADQLTDGDRYELSGGHAIYCAPAGQEHAASNLVGAAVCDTDPEVEWAGVDAGFAPEPETLWAPDVAVAAAPSQKQWGWMPGVPPLALEYAARGQDESALQEKIRDLLRRGTQQIWVVRLTGPRRVEVYVQGKAAQVVRPGGQLQAAGILRNPIPVEALYDRTAAHQVMLRNLLQRLGYEDLDSVREEGRKEGREEGREEGIARSILAVLRGRGLEVSKALEERVLACRQQNLLDAWLLAAVRVDQAEAIFDLI